jgi:tRNA G18 (ribose-2'-O)-methylase SpoU
MRIYGINPVLEALRARRVTALRVSPRADERLLALVRLAEAQGIPIRRANGSGRGRVRRAAHRRPRSD